MALPRLLDDQPALYLRAYPRETVVAEKLEAIVKLGMVNSRMKDYFDLLALLKEQRTDEGDLVNAIAATFARRGTPIPDVVPLGLTPEFADDGQKQTQWAAFVGKNRLEAPALAVVVEQLASWLQPAMQRAGGRAQGGH